MLNDLDSKFIEPNHPCWCFAK